MNRAITRRFNTADLVAILKLRAALTDLRRRIHAHVDKMLQTCAAGNAHRLQARLEIDVDELPRFCQTRMSDADKLYKGIGLIDQVPVGIAIERISNRRLRSPLAVWKVLFRRPAP